MRIAVLGSTGMAGHVVALWLEECGHTVYRTSRSEKNTNMSAAIDITDFELVAAWLDKIQPEAVVNCIGLLQKACDERRDLAVLINSYLPHWLEYRYRRAATKVIHLSTDCVFSGDRGGYLEGDLPDGRTVYDRSKALGEIQNEKDLTLRMSIIGPDTDPKGTGLFNWFMQQRGNIQGWSETYWNGVTTLELARAVEKAIKDNVTGLYHLVRPDKIDKYSLLCLIKEAFGRKDISITKTLGPQLDKSLINTRADFDFTVKSYPEQIRDTLNWVKAHREQYAHYMLR